MKNLITFLVISIILLSAAIICYIFDFKDVLFPIIITLVVTLFGSLAMAIELDFMYFLPEEENNKDSS